MSGKKRNKLRFAGENTILILLLIIFGRYSIARRSILSMRSELWDARAHLRTIIESCTAGQSVKFITLEKRLDVSECIINTTDHAMHYQVVLDRVVVQNEEAERNPSYHFIHPVDIKSRQELKRIARAEMDNVANLIQRFMKPSLQMRRSESGIGLNSYILLSMEVG